MPIVLNFLNGISVPPSKRFTKTYNLLWRSLSSLKKAMPFTSTLKRRRPPALAAVSSHYEPASLAELHLQQLRQGASSTAEAWQGFTIQGISVVKICHKHYKPSDQWREVSDGHAERLSSG